MPAAIRPAPVHLCPTCAAVFARAGGCPRGHGPLLDLTDAEDRAEAEALVEVLGMRDGVGEVLSPVIRVELIALVLTLCVTLYDDPSRLLSLLLETPLWLYLGGVGLVGLGIGLAWTLLSPRARRRHALQRHLRQTERLLEDANRSRIAQ